MSRFGQIALILTVALAATATGYGLYRQRPTTSATPVGTVAQLTSLQLSDTDDRPQSLAQWRGKVLVVNFWATWCTPCREEIPSFVSLSKKFAGKGVQFVGISIDSADKVREFSREHSVTYPLLLGNADSMQLTVAFGNKAQALPFTIVLDPSGEARLVKLGRVSESVLDETLAKLVAR